LKRLPFDDERALSGGLRRLQRLAETLPAINQRSVNPSESPTKAQVAIGSYLLAWLSHQA
jgi:hypothetical protein